LQLVRLKSGGLGFPAEATDLSCSTAVLPMALELERGVGAAAVAGVYMDVGRGGLLSTHPLRFLFVRVQGRSTRFPALHPQRPGLGYPTWRL
jgi:hypothetical protein